MTGSFPPPFPPPFPGPDPRRDQESGRAPGGGSGARPGGPTGPRLRAGDTDRQAAVDRLSEHFTAGRLTASEYDDRVRQAYASTFLDELPVLLADLPDENQPHTVGFGERRDRGTGWRWGDGRPGAGSPWWPDGLARGEDAGDERAQDRWGAGPRGYRHRPPVSLLPVLVVVALVIALSHGFVLIPLVWVGLAFLLFRRHRRGGCGRRVHHGMR